MSRPPNTPPQFAHWFNADGSVRWDQVDFGLQDIEIAKIVDRSRERVRQQRRKRRKPAPPTSGLPINSLKARLMAMDTRHMTLEDAAAALGVRPTPYIASILAQS